MGSGGTEWEVADVVSASRMNQKTIFVGTGAQIAALGTTYAGQKALCTSTGSGFTKDVEYVRNADNDAWNVSGAQLIPITTFESIDNSAVITSSKLLHKPSFRSFEVITKSTSGPHEVSDVLDSITGYIDYFAQYADQTAFDTAWPSQDTAKNRGSPTNNRIDLNLVADSTVDNIYHDFGASIIDEDNNKVRFAITFSSVTTGNGAVFHLVFTDDATSASNVARDAIGMRFQFTGASDGYGAIDTDGAALNATSAENVQSVSWTTTTYYFEIDFTSETAYTINRYPDATFTAADIIDSSTGTKSTNTEGCRYLTILNTSHTTDTGNFTGYIEFFENYLSAVI